MFRDDFSQNSGDLKFCFRTKNLTEKNAAAQFQHLGGHLVVHFAAGPLVTTEAPRIAQTRP